MDSHIINNPNIQKRGVVIIILYGETDDFIQRLKTRNKPSIPFKYKELTLENLVKVATAKLPDIYPTAYYIKTDNSSDIEINYKKFEGKIEWCKKKIDEYLVE